MSDSVKIPAPSPSGDPLVSVVIPCLNEAEGVGVCVEKALRAMREMGVPGEVVVVDNGSTDGSAEVAARAGARVVHEERRGTARPTCAASRRRAASISSWATPTTPTTSSTSRAS